MALKRGLAKMGRCGYPLKKLKYIATICNGQEYKHVEGDEHGIPVYGSGGVFAYAKKPIYEGISVLLGRKGTIDKPLYVDEAFWTVDTMYYTRIKADNYPKYVYYACNTIPFEFLQYGSAVPSMTSTDLGNTYLPFPDYETQKLVASYLDEKESYLSEVQSMYYVQLSMLTRYKRDLIAECVTKGLNKDAPMRPSGEDWIGDVPEHWKIVPLRAFLKSNNKKNPGGLPLLSVERERGVVNRETDGSPDNYNRIPDDLSNYKMVNEGQFVMNKMKAWQGSYGVAPCDGIVSPAYHVYDLVFENKAFFNYAIRSKCYVGFLGRDSYGIRTDQWDFKAECIKHIPFVVPSLEEQKEIVNYLSKQVSRINSLQENITSQIQKLKDYRRILIHDAVTGKIKI